MTPSLVIGIPLFSYHSPDRTTSKVKVFSVTDRSVENDFPCLNPVRLRLQWRSAADIVPHDHRLLLLQPIQLARRLKARSIDEIAVCRLAAPEFCSSR